MPTQHTVQAGETLSGIAQQNGFRDWHTIYNAPENAAFRQKRPNPNLIVPGDVVRDWDFNMIVIHHSGLGGRKVPSDIQNFHMDDRGFDDIAYQYLILPNGSIVEGRYLSQEGASNAAVNTGKIGILVAGNFEPSILHHEDTLTAGQISQTELLANELKAEFPTITRLVGHRDLKSTECPGDDLYSQVPVFRAATGLAP